ncbi:MAG: HD domain-containing protein [Erysipelotrichaceae bacterium]|nr:HD domain-containing protein [Erysipelotrichaceae bacterium]
MLHKDSFDLATERLYRRDPNNLEIKETRIILLVFSFLYALFSISDYYLLNEYLPMLLVIRFCFVIPMFFLTIFLTYKKIFVEINQKIMMFNFILSGVGISVMLIIKPDNFIYYGGMFMIYFSGYLLINLDFIHAALGGSINFLLYFFGFIIYHGTVTSVFGYSSMFFIGANIIGMVGSYNFETIRRKNFINSLKIIEYNRDLKNEISKQTQDIAKINIEIVFALAKLVETRDHNTGVHTENVGKYCAIIAGNLDEKVYLEFNTTKGIYVDTIKVASVLHDIGKVGISDTILNKNGKLDQFEFELMKTHTLIGSDILEKIHKNYPQNEFINMGLNIARSHHERYDGTGYPDGLKGEAIPLSARIMALCDVYDALTTQRPYKEAFPHSKAVELIKAEKGSHFDPVIVEIFLNNQNRFI